MAAITKSRVAELDLLRFVAAISVVLYHYGYGAPFGVAASHVTEFGFLGVQLFFMISGFVILWTAMNKSAFEFIASRISRLYPTFWACVLLTAATLFFLGRKIGPRMLLANLTMIPGPLRQPMLDDVYWTLVVEIKFYALMLAMLLTRQLANIRRWLGLWLGVSIFAAFGPHWLRYAALDQFSAYFIGGCYLFLIRNQKPSADLLIALGACAVLSVYNAIGVQESFTLDDSLRTQIWVGVVIILEYAVFLGVAARRLSLPQLPLWGRLGAITYPLYLIHSGTVENLGLRYLIGGPARFTLMLLASLLIAWLLAITIERRACAAFNRWLLAIPSSQLWRYGEDRD